MKAFEYKRPTSLEEASHLVRESNGQSSILAGGTDLLVQIKQERIRPQVVVSLRDIDGLDSIRTGTDGVTIGAMTPLRAVETAEEILEHWRPVAEAASWIGSVQVRNRATLGGNLCNAAPSADMAPILMAYGASAVLSDGQMDRSVPLEDFFTGPGETALEIGELMKAVQIPHPPSRCFGIYHKAYRSSMDIAVVGAGVRAVFEPDSQVCQDLRLVLGAVAPTPIRARESERMVVGSQIENGLINRASQKASEEARPIDDVRSTATYRRNMVRVLTRKGLLAASDWIEGGGNP
jgi:carbon-monoxide dehydrogenase medium subunit